LEKLFDSSWLTSFFFFSQHSYRPKDAPRHHVQQSLQAMQKAWIKKPMHERVREYRGLLSRFQPVMRHYFTERHRIPMGWFFLRLNYTRSVATNSIVGHILGLGDRHVSNILLDNTSGEVVHIDLGIAFDQVFVSYSLSPVN
jgi:serine-protein kinase ATM